MKAIKIAVAIMTILLVAGFAVVIYTISTRLSDGTLSKKSDEAPQEISSSTDVDEERSVFESVPVDIPAGCRLADAHMERGNVLLRFDGDLERGCQKVELYSIDGRKLGSWDVDLSKENSQ